MLANAGKILVTKTAARDADPRTLVLSARLAAAAVLLPLFPLLGLPWPTSPWFWGIVLLTALLTALASTVLSWTVQRGPLGIVMPMQATLPVWMVLMLAALGKEPIPPAGWAGVLLSAASLAVVLAERPRTPARTPPGGVLLEDEWVDEPATTPKDANRNTTRLRTTEPEPTERTPTPAWMYGAASLGVAVVLAACTLLDRSAIAAAVAGGLVYSACWNLVSTGVMLLTQTVRPSAERQPWGAILAFAACGLVAFVAQQVAVEWSQTIPGGVLHVKLIVMLHLPVVTLVGAFGLGERLSYRGWLGVCGAFGGGLVTLLSRSG